MFTRESVMIPFIPDPAQGLGPAHAGHSGTLLCCHWELPTGKPPPPGAHHPWEMDLWNPGPLTQQPVTCPGPCDDPGDVSQWGCSKGPQRVPLSLCSLGEQ